ncbi:MAG: hypothetical protein ACREVG_14820, partial [Burkholderiales bacterium]
MIDKRHSTIASLFRREPRIATLRHQVPSLFWGINEGKLFPEAAGETHPLTHALVPFLPRVIQKGELADEVELIELEDVEKKTGVVIVFQAQIDREKRGMGNMTNIFPPEV